MTTPVDDVDGAGVQPVHRVGRAQGGLRAGVARRRLHHLQRQLKRRWCYFSVFQLLKDERKKMHIACATIMTKNIQETSFSPSRSK
jgi:hypothetical protein